MLFNVHGEAVQPKAKWFNPQIPSFHYGCGRCTSSKNSFGHPCTHHSPCIVGKGSKLLYDPRQCLTCLQRMEEAQSMEAKKKTTAVSLLTKLFTELRRRRQNAGSPTPEEMFCSSELFKWFFYWIPRPLVGRPSLTPRPKSTQTKVSILAHADSPK